MAIRLDPAHDDRLRQAAEILLAARRETRPISDLPQGLRPLNLAEAYRLQDIMVEAIGATGGWKVGAPNPTAEPVCAPLLLWGGFAGSGEHLSGQFRRMRGVEVEIAFRLGRDLPLRTESYLRAEVIAAIEGAHPILELLESAFEDLDKVDRLSMIGDLQQNGGFVYGDAVPDWQGIDLAQESATMIVDGVVRVSAVAGNPAGTDLVRLVQWLANEGQYRTGGLKAGEWITTGSWTGKVLAQPGSQVRGSFSHFGEVWAQFE